ncbi:MAG: hypothetical protein WC915_06120 [archaeon]|jgi:hypothetical protein
MQLNKNSKAQGTIEYLVILAIVIVIGLVIVGMMVSINDTQNITQKNDKLKNMIGTGGISVLEAIVDEDGTGLITLKGTGTETLTIESITVDGGSENIYSTNLYNKDLTFAIKHLGTLCQCEPGQRNTTCNLNIQIHTQTGLTKTIPITINAECATDINTTNPNIYIQPQLNLCADYPNLAEYNGNKIVCNCIDLQNIDSNLTANYLLGQDINCYDTINWNAPNGFEPIGSFTTRFSGNFNGNGHTISNLYINYPSGTNIGLFGYIEDSTIQNVGLIDNNIKGNNYTGGIVGLNESGFILNNYTSGTVNSLTSFAGGIVGGNSNIGTVVNNYSLGNTTSPQVVGGIIGWNARDSIVKNNYSTGNNTGGAMIGGVVGYNNYGIVENNYAVGYVNATSGWSGGLIGQEIPGETNNNYWDITLTTQTQCNYYDNIGCDYTDNDEAAYYGSGGLPFDVNLNFDGNWIAQDNNHPILYWQN